ncbi:hypothetical protein M9H77_08945 [Catharanthus roseus]|uniref:Uncharacterized protein n=1 Tax=Catharanthus roseus TaxID=4058 RepID=A0ACC0BZA7_CATRO|nr:hypothetical protein M9H77_08945 [Catharanthus roseus]
MKTSFRPGLKFVKNQVNGRVSGLHCTWLVLHTRASSNDVDRFFTLRVDPLEEERSTLRGGPTGIYVDNASCSAVGRSPSEELARNGQGPSKPLKVVYYCEAYNLVPRGTQMPYSAEVDLVAGLGASHRMTLTMDLSFIMYSWWK